MKYGKFQRNKNQITLIILNNSDLFVNGLKDQKFILKNNNWILCGKNNSFIFQSPNQLIKIKEDNFQKMLKNFKSKLNKKKRLLKNLSKCELIPKLYLANKNDQKIEFEIIKIKSEEFKAKFNAEVCLFNFYL